MGAAEIRAVKAAVAEYVGLVNSCTIGSVTSHVRVATGLDFAGPTIAKYVSAHGFKRHDDRTGGPITYRRDPPIAIQLPLRVPK